MTEQVSHAVEAIKLAYLSHTPVVWLVTGDKEVASDIVEQFTIEHYGEFRSKKGQISYVNIEEFSQVSADASSMQPRIFYKWVGNDKDVMSSVENFITVHGNMVADFDVQSKTVEHIQNVFFSLVIIASPTLPPESWLTKYIEVVYVKALQDSEIKEIVINTLSSKGIAFEDEDLFRELTVNLRGFSARKITQTISRCIVSGFFDYNKVQWSKILCEIRFIKRQLLDGFVGLKWIDVEDDKKQKRVGKQAEISESLNVISNWLDARKEIFKDTERAKKSGYDIPKGVLITGIPGTGKSMMAKETSKKLDLPLIALDMGDLQEGIVGASEQHMVKALHMVEAMAPCVLWIDEIEKAFSGSNSGSSDGGVMRRMFGKFLTWMQEKTAPCFVFATSNDISKLPPELFRSERFDDKYFSFMPMVDECAAIFSSLIKNENAKYMKNNPDDEQGCLFAVELTKPYVWKGFLNSYARECGMIDMDGNKWKDGKIPQRKLFTGADISTVVKLTKFELLKESNGRASNIQREHVLNTIKKTLADFMPYGQTNLKDIANCFVQLSNNRFKSASSPSVINFNDYNVETAEMSYYADRYSNDYDKVLYAAVVGAINFYPKKEEANRRNLVSVVNNENI